MYMHLIIKQKQARRSVQTKTRENGAEMKIVQRSYFNTKSKQRSRYDKSNIFK